MWSLPFNFCREQMHSKAMFVAVHSRVTFTSVTVTKSRKSHGSVRFEEEDIT